MDRKTDTGAIVENHAFLSLRNSFSDKTINFWRTTAKAEVDFTLRLDNEIIPIETRYQTFQKPKISRSLRSFIKTFKPQKALIITKTSGTKKKSKTQ